MPDPEVTRNGLESVASSDPSAGALRPGVVFAERYRIETQIGLGGMGAVYKAFDLELNLTVALKTIRADAAAASGGESLARRFKQELLLAREVSHPNILRIHDLGNAGGLKYITMAFVEGVDLAGLLRESSRLPTQRVVSIGRQVAAGLAAAHDVGVLHRDLKPQNILVDARDHVYVSDFGLATSVDMTMAALTRTGDFLGTPRYAAPEQVSGKPFDKRTDIYALGLVLYEMATGAVPFDGGSLLDTMLRRVQERPREPLTINPDVPPFLNRIIMRCLETDPEARYQNAHDIAADLDAGRAPGAARGSIVSRVRHRFAHMTALPWAITAIVVLAGIGAGAVALRKAIVERRQARSETTAPVAIQRLALLPFTTVGDAAVTNAASGINEALTAKLFQLKGVALASSTAVTRAARKPTLDETARDVGATYLISGTVQGSGERLRVTASVHQVDHGTTWSQEFSGLTGDLLTLEDQMFAALVPQLGLHPDSAELTRTLAHPTENLDAYGDYLKGRGAMRNEQDLQNVQQAIAFYNQALAKDRSFSLAYSGLADASLRMYRATKDPKWSTEALSAAQQAQALDDGSLEAHIVLGSVYQATGKTAEALVELRRAVDIAPNSDEAHRRLGRAYLSSGRQREAIEAYKKAVSVNPYHWVNHGSLGSAYLQVADYDSAIDAFKKEIDIAPQNVNGHNDLGAAYLQVGRYDEAIRSLAKALEIQKIPNTYTNLAIAYAGAGRFGDAVPMFEEAVKLQPQSEQFVGNLADGYRWAGRTAEASAAYDRAIGLAVKALQVNPRDAGTKGNLALYYAKKGDLVQARKLMADARALDAGNVGLIYNEAVMHGLAGDNDAALASLARAIKAGYPASAATSDPDLRRLREDPRYRQAITPGRPST